MEKWRRSFLATKGRRVVILDAKDAKIAKVGRMLGRFFPLAAPVKWFRWVFNFLFLLFSGRECDILRAT